MAKKILSILCALAMMVTMVSVAAFSASAAETGTFAGFGDANVTFGSTSYSGQFTSDTYGDGIFPWQTTADVSFDENYNIGDSFSLSFYYATGYHGSTSKQFELTFNLGDLQVYVYNTGSAPYETFEVYYGETLLGTDAGTWGHYVTTSKGVIPAIFEDMGKTAPNDSDVGLNHKLVTCTYENDTITVTIGKEGSTTAIKTITGTVADADFSDAAMTFIAKENAWYPAMMYNLSGTYAKASTGDEGGETPDPEVPTTGTFATLSNMTVAKSRYVSGDYFCNLGSGYFYSDYYNSEAMVTSQGRITASSGPYAIGDEFSFSYNVIRDAWPANLTTISDGSQVHGYLNVVTLGDLRIEMSSDNTPFVTVNAYYGDTQIITNAVSGSWSENNYGVEFGSTSDEWKSNFSFERNADDTAYVGEVFNKIPTAVSGGQNTYYATAKKKAEVTVSYSNGVLTVTYGKIDATTPYTVTANLTNADFSNASLAVSVAEVNNRGTMLYDFAGTYTPYVAPATDPLAPGKFLSINDSLSVNFAYAEGTLADYTDVEVNASIGGKGETLTSVKKTLTDGVYDVYVVDFLTPDLFGTDIEFEITAKDSTGADVSYTTTYSVKQYCVNMMTGDDADLDNLCAAILEYGEAARLWKLDEGMTAPTTSITDGLTYTAPTKWTADGKTSTFGLSVEPTNVVAEWGEFNLNLADNVGANLRVTLADGESIDNYYASVDGINVVGGDLESLVSLGNNKYKAVIRVYAYEMANDFTVKVKEVGTNEDVSYTFTTGVQNYILKGIETGVFVEGATDYNCAVALLTYGAAAAAYNS